MSVTVPAGLFAQTARFHAFLFFAVTSTASNVFFMPHNDQRIKLVYVLSACTGCVCSLCVVRAASEVGLQSKSAGAHLLLSDESNNRALIYNILQFDPCQWVFHTLFL